LEYITADLLSQSNFNNLSMPSTMHSLITKFRNHVSRLHASQHATNSATMVEETMSVCLALFQEMAHPTSK